MLRQVIPKSVSKFFVRFLAIYFVLQLVMVSPPIFLSYNKAFSSIQSWVFNTWHPYMHIKMSTDTEKENLQDQDIILYGFHKATYNNYIKNQILGHNTDILEPRKILAFNSSNTWNQYVFLLWALIFATPGGWKKSMASALVGTYLLCLFISMKLTFVAEISSGDYVHTLWHQASNFFGTNRSYQEISFLFVILIWVVVSVDSNIFEHPSQKNRPIQKIIPLV